MNKNKLIILALLLLIITLTACSSKNSNITEEMCISGSGTWIEESQECVIEEINTEINTTEETNINLQEICETNSGNWIEESQECIIEEINTEINTTEETNINLQEICETNSGNWIEEYNECEYLSEELCTELNGTYTDCASACRHIDDPEVMCTMQCVLVCSFEN